jgi:hypothetical protein
MSLRDQQKKIVIGIILLFVISIVFTGSVKGQENSTSATPLSTVSIYDQPKDPETGVNSPNSLQKDTSSDMGETTTGNDIPVPFPEEDILFEKVCDPTTIELDEEMTCTITIKNNGDRDFSYKVLDFVSRHMTIQEDSVIGGDLLGHRIISQYGVLAGGTLPSFAIESTDTPLIYDSLAGLGIPPLTGVQDDAMINVATLEPYIYAGDEYTTIGIASNGYLIPGLGSDEDIAFIPQIFPDPEIPNNVVAPFWTDLNPEAGGNIYAALLTRDGESWVVIEWEDMPAFDAEKPVPNCVDNCDNKYTFQAWLKTNTVEQDITFVYAAVGGSGAASGLNIGVENKDGTQGANYESVPTADEDLVVVKTPGTDGETHIISYTAQADKSGHWYGCALLKVFSVHGITFDCAYGEVIGDSESLLQE